MMSDVDANARAATGRRLSTEHREADGGALEAHDGEHRHAGEDEQEHDADHHGRRRPRHEQHDGEARDDGGHRRADLLHPLGAQRPVRPLPRHAAHAWVPTLLTAGRVVRAS